MLRNGHRIRRRSLRPGTSRSRIIYNEEYDAFDVEIETKEGWKLEKRFLCMAVEEAPTIHKFYIHFSVLRKINDLQNIGYKVKIDQ